MSAVPVNISNTFPSRCRCKGCGKVPDIKYADISFRRFKGFFNGTLGRSKRGFYTTVTYDYNHHYFKKTAHIDGLNPQYHKNHRYPTQVYGASNITDYVVCPCGKSMWAFRCYDDRIETEHRRSNYNYC